MDMSGYRLVAPLNRSRPAYVQIRPISKELRRQVDGHPGLARDDGNGVVLRVGDEGHEKTIFVIAPADFNLPPEWRQVRLGAPLDALTLTSSDAILQHGFFAVGCSHDEVAALLGASSSESEPSDEPEVDEPEHPEATEKPPPRRTRRRVVTE